MSNNKSWTEGKVQNYWSGRLCSSVIIDTCLASKQEEMNKNKAERDAKLKKEKSQFLTCSLSDSEYPIQKPNPAQDVVDNLSFWIKYLSWTYCDTCHLLKKQLLPHNFQKRPVTKPHPCICKLNKYVIPDWENIPLALSFLEMEDFVVLRPCLSFERIRMCVMAIPIPVHSMVRIFHFWKGR